ncbi:hypothetical protein [Cyclobacterium sp. SYSU L10401]|nr:hypothetical protein [Cyclobacterium sp. SYSU L10401]
MDREAWHPGPSLKMSYKRHVLPLGLPESSPLVALLRDKLLAH